MNNEKVKEIKHKLQEAIEYCARELEKDLFEKSLTLINELESENERLKQSNKNILFVNEQVIKRNEELEQKNGELEQHITEVEKGIINIAKERNKKDELASKFIDSYNDSLKQFAERLIEKKIRLGDRFNIYDIDETLKEFLGE